jgi:hypothetical protein
MLSVSVGETDCELTGEASCVGVDEVEDDKKDPPRGRYHRPDRDNRGRRMS